MSRTRWAVLQTFIIGRQDNPMMKRIRLLQTPWFGVYLHAIYREDLDADPHDHPWNFVRMVLKGGYVEEYHGDGRGAERTQGPFLPGYVPVRHFHRITAVKPGTVSLVIVGRKQRKWGFWVPTRPAFSQARTWVYFRDYLNHNTTQETTVPDQPTETNTVEAPTEPGWYAYSGGRQTMIFYLNPAGQWRVFNQNGMTAECVWGYIEQALSVWDLVRIDPTSPPIPTESEYVEYGVDVPMPYHLRDDAPPLSSCTSCGRKTWDQATVGEPCGMPQSDGSVCSGLFPADHG